VDWECESVPVSLPGVEAQLYHPRYFAGKLRDECEPVARIRTGGGGLIDLGKRSVVGVKVDAVDYEAALVRILQAALEHRAYSVSALAVHGVMTGVQSDAHKFRLNSFDLVVPDGQPVRWALNWLYDAGLSDRVYGPKLTLLALEMAANERLQVYFYGSTPAVIEKLVLRVRQLYPALTVAGAEASKFRNLDGDERVALARRISLSGASIVFIGLGCPRQEIFAYEMKSLLPMPILAVGAAFPFIAGELAQAPAWVQRAGLEWLYRLAKEPRRLWRRYVLLNPHFLLLLTAQLAGIHYYTAGSKPQTEIRYG
jgi:N-acetylglucosaminyldiphosphoundecaprenol N-acetyl-beta-D-mannosaminyltransferase